MKTLGSAAIALLLVAGSAWAQPGAGPQPMMPAPFVPAPQDRPFNGAIRLEVDATDTVHRVFTVHETIPVQQAGRMVLLYPEYETGSHAATASIAALAGLTLHVGGQPLAWRRDPLNPYAFEVEVPAGVTAVEADFQFLSPTGPRQGPMRMTPGMVTIAWQTLLLYPAGWFTRDIPVAASLRLPAGMTPATTLAPTRAPTSGAGGMLSFATETLEDLVDSPVYAGRHVREVPLSQDKAAPVTLALLAEKAGDLETTPAQIAGLARMVSQTHRLLGAAHYRRYALIVALNDQLPGPGGFEHMESSENATPPDFFQAADGYAIYQDLFAHEFVHSWNGRYRQPAGLWTPTYNQPVDGSLLWVYEGQTEFWGRVLAARAGLRTVAQTLDALAIDAAVAQSRIGRAWKSLQDSANDPSIAIGRSMVWRDWQRREDYYGEGVLLWLDADSLIRERTGGKRGLDDVARALFGGPAGDRVIRTYGFDDVCAALNSVLPFDWATFLRRRLDAHDDTGLLDGLTRGGYRLVFTDTPTDYFRQTETDGGGIDLSYSIGLVVDAKGQARAIAWNGPAFRAGLTVGGRLTAVNGQPFSSDRLIEAVRQAATHPVELRFDSDGAEHTAAVDYHGTLRYPRLERVTGTPDRLTALLRPLP
ncbi:peptidase M61 [Nitrospirillum viridazoti Y2]|uniref:Glycyl aminopeptidase n=1 Tax=Nitrospirillum amazonense TaxID=28077 RepID=A0A560HRI0_9PROT|nr:M61 family metallopeptidase [Nitrospirillum amazonense]EGY02446.1 peptidase M61 [Nitrospirillum amazonense Y2]TWB47640.1 glycyl aminopeptidase [Nitrospirillum amazonense]